MCKEPMNWIELGGAAEATHSKDCFGRLWTNKRRELSRRDRNPPNMCYRFLSGWGVLPLMYVMDVQLQAQKMRDTGRSWNQLWFCHVLSISSSSSGGSTSCQFRGSQHSSRPMLSASTLSFRPVKSAVAGKRPCSSWTLRETWRTTLGETAWIGASHDSPGERNQSCSAEWSSHWDDPAGNDLLIHKITVFSGSNLPVWGQRSPCPPFHLWWSRMCWNETTCMTVYVHALQRHVYTFISIFSICCHLACLVPNIDS